MKTVGSHLREVRESLGIQLEEAANVTRIGKNYLSAIEGDMYDKLPSAAYVKGFLRVYAGFLGLSGDDVVAMYDGQTSQYPSQTSEISDGEGGAESKPSRSRPVRRLAPIILFIFIAAAVVYFVICGEEKVQNIPPSTDRKPLAAAPALPLLSSAVQKDLTGNLLATKQDSGPVAKEVPPLPVGIILKMKVNQDCWLNITIDDSVSQQYLLKGGDLIEWKGKKVFALDIGNAGGVEAELNGKPLAPFGAQGKVAHVVLKGEGD